MFTTRCVCAMDFLDVMLSKCDLATQFIALLHSRSLKRGIFQRVWTPGRIDLCQHYLDSDIWHLRVFDACLICAYSCLDSDFLHLGVFLASSTLMRSVSTVVLILTFGMLGFMSLG